MGAGHHQRVRGNGQTKDANLNYYAHTAEGEIGERLDHEHWQPLSEHLRNVADKALEFATPFGPAAKWTGLLHDLGKYRKPFQEYLAGTRPGSIETHHAVYGAALAFRRNWLGPAFAIAGGAVA